VQEQLVGANVAIPPETEPIKDGLKDGCIASSFWRLTAAQTYAFGDGILLQQHPVLGHQDSTHQYPGTLHEMRGTMTQRMANVPSIIKAELQVGTAGSFRSAFICAHCRRQAFSRSATQHFPTTRRTFTSTIRFHNQTVPAAGPSQPPSTSTPSIPQSHYDFFPLTFPSGPPPASPFTPDLKALRREFLQLQAKAHPDLASSSGSGQQKRQAEALSSRINEAYRTLLDPLKRAQYLLLQAGIDVEDESAKMSGGTLLMEVMEAREAVEEVESEEELIVIREENDARIAESVRVLDDAFREGRLDAAAEEAVRLRYWMNIEESIRGWEKGRGGGVIHH
jgi:molecular chaperone HscB